MGGVGEAHHRPVATIAILLEMRDASGACPKADMSTGLDRHPDPGGHHKRQSEAVRNDDLRLTRTLRNLANALKYAFDELSTLVDWHFMDATLALGWDQTMSLDKLRRHGFGDAVDTSAMILDILTAYRHQGILPR